MFYVLLLVCVFETFRNESTNSFKSDPAHYLFTPECSWNAVLKFTDISLKLIWNIEKHHTIENTIRGDISMIYKNYSVANNEFLKFYDANKPTW